jgi:DNA-binding NarL/FixJ family response regulator
MEHDTNTSVFIVEDSPAVRDALVDLIDDVEGVTIAGSAADAPTAIDAITKSHPDYVVLDYQLVGSTGVDVLRAVHPKLPEIVFIVLTNHASAQYRRICMSAGATWFLDKTREFAKVKDIVAQLAQPNHS